MCRIVAQFSIKPQQGYAPLVGDPYSLLAQSNANPRRLQQDGWGVSWYENGRPHSVHSTQPVFQEKLRFSQLVRQVSTNLLIAHIRAASNPLALPRQIILRLENTQPFIRPPWIFAHNGTLYPVKSLKAELGGAVAPLQGNNDSELLFLVLLRHWRRAGASMSYAVNGVLELLYRLDPYPFSALNFVATDGEKFYAYCHWNAKRSDDERRSLVLGTQSFFQMSYHVSQERIIVASEPTNSSPGWHFLRQGELLIAQRQKGEIRYDTYFLFP